MLATFLVTKIPTDGNLKEKRFDSISDDTILHGRNDLSEASVHGGGGVSKSLLARGHLIMQKYIQSHLENPQF